MENRSTSLKSQLLTISVPAIMVSTLVAPLSRLKYLYQSMNFLQIYKYEKTYQISKFLPSTHYI